MYIYILLMLKSLNDILDGVSWVVWIRKQNIMNKIYNVVTKNCTQACYQFLVFSIQYEIEISQ